ncbi:MAG: esterase family protein [Chitinophagaceae bacterium]|nr:esterase family protein [Chitinophagaceae bacterium]
MRYSFLIFILFSFVVANAARVDTLSIESKALRGMTKCVVITPDKYDANTDIRLPVVYLLHGYSGDFSNWVTRVPEIKEYADKYQLIIVCPDGKNSFYLNNVNNNLPQYEDYIALELPAFIDSHYRTLSDKLFRVITGLSMGGHGAVVAAVRHQDVFGAAGSMSGVMDLVGRRMRKEIIDAIGDTSVEKVGAFSSVQLAEVREIKLPLIIDCGVDDPLLPGNRELHRVLTARKIAHDYIERDGAHSWDYWRNSIEYHLLFFRKWFDKNLLKS